MNAMVSSRYDVEYSTCIARSAVTATPDITRSHVAASSAGSSVDAIDRHELEADAEIARELVGHLHVEADEIARRC